MPSKPYFPHLLKKLSDSDYAVEYLTQVFHNESQEAFLLALGHVIDARSEECYKIS